MTTAAIDIVELEKFYNSIDIGRGGIIALVGFDGIVRARSGRDPAAHDLVGQSAARTRLRPNLMTSFAFILGVAPLAVATGAGSEMRQSLGTAVLFGMIGVTGFGLAFTPAFYTFIRNLGTRRAA